MEGQCVRYDDYNSAELHGKIEVDVSLLTEAVCYPAGGVAVCKL